MGSWSASKDNAWRVMRGLTAAKPVTDYSLLSGTPPTVRQATEPYLKALSDRMEQPVDDLRKVTQGATDPKRSREAPGHVCMQWAKICGVCDNEIQPFWAAKVPADRVWPVLTEKMDAVTQATDTQLTDSLPQG